MTQLPKIEWQRIPRLGFIKAHWLGEANGLRFKIWAHRSGGTRFRRGQLSYVLANGAARTAHTTLAEAREHAAYLAWGGK